MWENSYKYAQKTFQVGLAYGREKAYIPLLSPTVNGVSRQTLEWSVSFQDLYVLLNHYDTNSLFR